jgi:hypothetical protein
MQRRLDRTIDLIKAAYPSWTKDADLLSFQLLNDFPISSTILRAVRYINFYKRDRPARYLVGRRSDRDNA